MAELDFNWASPTPKPVHLAPHHTLSTWLKSKPKHFLKKKKEIK